LRECSFREQPAQQVGQLEGNEESVGHQSGAENPGNHEIAHEAQDAREEGHATDGGQGFQQIHRSLLASGEAAILAAYRGE